MIVKTAAVLSLFLFTACGDDSNDLQADKPDTSARVDSCDLRSVSGTCMEYTVSELDDWYQEYVESACPKHRRGQFNGIYKTNTHCPSENRVARCENIKEDVAERYEYDKHYYAGTADGYSWQAANVQVTCESISGDFLHE